MARLDIRQFANLNGVPSNTVHDLQTPYVSYSATEGWQLKGVAYPEINDTLIKCDAHFQHTVFGSVASFRELQPGISIAVCDVGHSSDASMSKEQFETFIGKYRKLRGTSETHRELYYYDCEALTANIGFCVIEITQLVGEFYAALNSIDTNLASSQNLESVWKTTGPQSTIVIALLGACILKLHTLLDYTTKLTKEIINTTTEFDTYPKLSSTNTQYNRKRKPEEISTASSTIFDESDVLDEVHTLRHYVSHEGFVDSIPAIQESYKDGELVEAFVLLPDREEMSFAKFGNRKRFFSKDDKINYRLPSMVRELFERVENTLHAALNHI